jgi:integrase
VPKSAKASKPLKFPYFVQVGYVVIAVKEYQSKDGPRYGFEDYTSGKRIRRRNRDALKTIAEAVRIAESIARGDQAAARLTNAQAHLFLRAVEIVPEDQLIQACLAWSRAHPSIKEPATLSDAIIQYLVHHQSIGSGKRHYQSIKGNLGRYVLAHPGLSVANPTRRSIQDWIDGLRTLRGQPMTPTSKKAFRASLSGFFSWCLSREMVAANPVSGVEVGRVRRKGRTLYWTADQCTRLLACIEPVARPSLAVALFTGLRTAEVCRVKWRDLSDDYLTISESDSKTSQRAVPVTDALRSFTLPRGNPDHRIFPMSEWEFIRLVSEACKVASIPRIHNGARHTFITMRVAETGDIPRVSYEAGNSVGVIKSHYLGICSKSEAKNFWAIRPLSKTTQRTE